MSGLDAAQRQVIARQVLNIKAQCDAVLETLGVVVVEQKAATPIVPQTGVAQPQKAVPTYFGAKPAENENGKESKEGSGTPRRR